MECDPHQLIEGCLIACYAAGLSRCFLYIRGEMPLAHERVARALDDAYAAGYIGKNVLGSNFSVDIVMHFGAGAYVVGEETALQVDALDLIGVYDFQRMNQVIIAYHALARGEIRLSAELAEYRLYTPQTVRCWRAGTGYALADWLSSRGHEPQWIDWPPRPWR